MGRGWTLRSDQISFLRLILDRRGDISGPNCNRSTGEPAEQVGLVTSCVTQGGHCTVRNVVLARCLSKVSLRGDYGYDTDRYHAEVHQWKQIFTFIIREYSSMIS